MTDNCKTRKPANCVFVDIDVKNKTGNDYNCLFGCPKVNEYELGKSCKDDLECSGHCDIDNQDVIREKTSKFYGEARYIPPIEIKELEKTIEITGRCDAYTREEKHGFGDIYFENGILRYSTGW